MPLTYRNRAQDSLLLVCCKYGPIS